MERANRVQKKGVPKKGVCNLCTILYCILSRCTDKKGLPYFLQLSSCMASIRFYDNIFKEYEAETHRQEGSRFGVGSRIKGEDGIGHCHLGHLERPNLRDLDDNELNVTQ